MNSGAQRHSLGGGPIGLSRADPRGMSSYMTFLDPIDAPVSYPHDNGPERRVTPRWTIGPDPMGIVAAPDIERHGTKTASAQPAAPLTVRLSQRADARAEPLVALDHHQTASREPAYHVESVSAVAESRPPVNHLTVVSCVTDNHIGSNTLTLSARRKEHHSQSQGAHDFPLHGSLLVQSHDLA